ncbi:MAG: hypothetical protein SFW66_07275, partial [Gammaproteobacteria bacterium]|nr:hypothetical protein [Gammaproteobacteria bacterium]
IVDVFNKLSLESGCYHLEAKLHENKWEIVEINPRVGGAYISKSIELLTGGYDLLLLWLSTLIVSSESESKKIHKNLFNISTRNKQFHSRDVRTFFRVYFATRFGVIKSISVKDLFINPSEYKIFLKRGQKINNTSREVFAAQAIWTMNSKSNEELSKLIEESHKLMEIEYE